MEQESSFEVFEEETLEDLQLGGYFILQKEKAFRFGMDAVLLSNFTASDLKFKKDFTLLDLGTGTGILPILLAAKTRASLLTGIEIQAPMAEMARRSVQGNGLSGRIEILDLDIKEASLRLPLGSFDNVATNPPYTKAGGGMINPGDTKAISRHELLCTLRDVVKTAAALLKPNGSFYMVHRPDRLSEIFAQMQAFKLEPKLLRLVCPRLGEAPSLILVKGTKFGNPGMKLPPPIYIYDSEGRYTEEVQMAYGT